MRELLLKLRPTKIKGSKNFYIVLGIFVFALVLRLIGIKHGFPFIFHPDEPAVVRSATGIRFDANPAHFDWPHLHFYLNYIVFWVFIKFRGLLQIVGLQPFLAGKFPLLWRDPLVFYALSRIFDAFLGALTVVPLYLTGKKLFGKKVGRLAAFALAITPFHVHASHFALIDVPMTLWIAWAFYFSTKIYKKGKLNSYLWAGLFIGFAASTKYNGGLAAIVVALAHLFRVINNTDVSFLKRFFKLEDLKKIILSGISAILGFFIGTPYALFDFDTFSRTDGPVGAFWQFKNVGSVSLELRIQQFFDAITFRFAPDFGYVFIIGFVMFIGYALIKKKQKYWLIIWPALFLFFYTAGFVKMRTHYFMPTYPFVILGFAVMAQEIIKKVKKVYRPTLMVMLLILPLYFSIYRINLLVAKDTRVLLYEWMQENVTLLDEFVYNSSSLNPVLEKFDNRATKGVTKENIVNVSTGYVFVYSDGDTSTLELKSRLDKDAYWLEEEGWERIEFISPEGRRGNMIFIYERLGE